MGPDLIPFFFICTQIERIHFSSIPTNEMSEAAAAEDYALASQLKFERDLKRDHVHWSIIYENNQSQTTLTEKTPLNIQLS